MNLNLENPRMSKSKINFPKVRKSLQINYGLSIQTPPPNTIWDCESSNFGNRMAIIDEIHNRYANIDPTKFYSISNQFESSNVKEIPKLDRTP